MRLHAEDTDVKEELFRFCTLEDLVVAKLGVTPRMALSQAARTMLFNRRSGDWDDHLLHLSGLPGEVLGEVAYPGEVIGEMLRTACGLSAGTIIASGGHDQFLAALGTGASGVTALWSSGTVESIALLSHESRLRQGVPTYQVDHGQWVSPVPNLNGGGALAWLCELVGAPDPATLLDTCEPGAAELILVPTLGATGAPDYNAAATGLMAGLRADTYAHDLAQAMVRGITHETVHAASLFGPAALSRIEGFALAGGGSRSAYWNRVRAAAFGKPVTTRVHHDSGCIGAGLLAYAALTGARPELDLFNPPLGRIEPTSMDIAQFQLEHQRYLDLRETALGTTSREQRI